MNIWHWLVVLFLSNNYWAVIKMVWGNYSPLTSRAEKVAKTIIFPIIFPYIFLICGYIQLYPKFYTLVSWNPNWDFASKLFWVTLACMVFNTLLMTYFPSKGDEITDSTGRRLIAESRNLTGDAIRSAASVSWNFAFKEEMIFRFQGFFTVLGILSVLQMWIPYDITSFFTYLPEWLSLGAASILPHSSFAALFISNIVFAAIHIFDKDKVNFRIIHRVFVAWFIGWILVISLVLFGIVGAVITHFLIDFVLFFPMFLVSFKRIKKQYWDKKYGPI